MIYETHFNYALWSGAGAAIQRPWLQISAGGRQALPAPAAWLRRVPKWPMGPASLMYADTADV